MFPGQGSQKVGMGQAFYEEYEVVQQLYELANDALQFDIKELMFTGPAEKLTATENAQPALVLSSIAAYTILKQENIVPDMVVGHSLGEYSALVAAGVLSLQDALPLVATRGRLMEKAYPKGKGTMAAVLGLSEAEIRSVINEHIADEVVDLANLNCPGQIVISGSKTGVELATERLKEAGARRVIPLNVSGPFHSRLMQPASEEFANHLHNVTFHDANIPVYANVTAQSVKDKETIKQLLVEQLYSPVQFEASIRNMLKEDVTAFIEVGTGNVLCGLVKKIDRNVKTFAVQDPDSLATFISWYKEEE